MAEGRVGLKGGTAAVALSPAPVGARDGAPPLDAYLGALRAYHPSRVALIAEAMGLTDVPGRAGALAGAVAERLGEPRAAARVLEGLPDAPRQALSLFALTESTAWPLRALVHALSALGVEAGAVQPLLDLGLAAGSAGPDAVPTPTPAPPAPTQAGETMVYAHPAAVSAARTVLPDRLALTRSGPVRRERESDGLEPILRLAVVWQRVAEAPLRQTHQGTVYKRDRERLEDDPAVAGPIADALEPLPDMPALWLALARGVGLLEAEPGSDRLRAARPEFWAENAFHLPQMVAARWLGLWTWHEQGGMQHDGAEVLLAWPFVRAPVLLWLATLGPDEWAAHDDLAELLRARSPRWDRPAFQGDVRLEPAEPPSARGKEKGRGARGKTADSGGSTSPGAAALGAMLLGAAYQLNLVRTAEEVPSGRRVVQLTALGRYLLALGPPPPPRPSYEHFLYVQPSFEVIAYRQGLTPSLVGRFSRFAVWSQVGAALALRLTPESVYRGLEGGLTTQAMFDLLQRHSQRPLPAGVAEALRTWAGRRERVTYHAAATLVEFATAADLEQALGSWPVVDDRPAPVRVSDRLVLVEDDRSIPFDRFRLTGSRNYRTPPEACVEVGDDGVTLAIDPARSDLLVDAELARFTDEMPRGASPSGDPRRRFVVTAGSLARAAEGGFTAAPLAAWFARRTGRDVPPAVRLLLLAASSRVPELSAGRPLLLRTPTAEVLDGLAQHPETRDLLGERLGPTAAVIPDDALDAFRNALARLGLSLADVDGGDRGAPGPARGARHLPSAGGGS
jgi:hypothetical protein